MNRIRTYSQLLFLMVYLSACNNKPSNTDSTAADTVSANISDTIDYEVPEDGPEPYDIGPTDTILINGYLLCFEPSGPVTFPDYYPEQAARDSIAKAIGNSHEQAIAFEDYLKPKYPTIFTTGDSTVIIQLANNKRVSFRKSGGSVEDEWYNFDHYFPEIDYVLLHVQYYEGSAYLLVNRKNGFTRTIPGKPYFSKDRKHFIATSVDLEAHYSFNGLAYYTLENDSIAEQFKLEINAWGPEQVKWLSDTTIAIEKECWRTEPESNGNTFITQYGVMTIKRLR